MPKIDRGIPFSVTAVSTGTGNVTATATKSAGTNVIYFITDIAGSAYGSGSITILGGAAGATSLWAVGFGTTTTYSSFNQSFAEPLTGTAGQSVAVTVVGGAQAYANISGFGINKV